MTIFYLFLLNELPVTHLNNIQYYVIHVYCRARDPVGVVRPPAGGLQPRHLPVLRLRLQVGRFNVF